ncbi:MAG: type II toxin-antitoxin system PemK/MazF family toxin [Candidatus Paceibacterota bacterium]|jgi:mRNA interferase MazF
MAEEKEFDRWNSKKQKLDEHQSGPHCHEREIWWCSIGVNVGSEQYSQTEDFSRPVLVARRFTKDIFLGIPLTTKLRDGVPFRFRLRVGDVDNDALILQMRVYDRKRLVRPLAVVQKEVFKKLIEAIVCDLKTTDPALAGSSGAEANV